MKRQILFLVGLTLLPFFYVLSLSIGIYIPMAELYTEYVEHYKSGEPFGAFD